MELYHYLNAGCSVFAAAGLSYVVLSSHVREGFIIKAGLVMMILGLIGTALLILADAQSWRGLWNAGLLTRAGLCVVIAGYCWRRKKAGHHMLREGDWREPPKTLRSDQLRHVAGGKGGA